METVLEIRYGIVCRSSTPPSRCGDASSFRGSIQSFCTMALRPDRRVLSPRPHASYDHRARSIQSQSQVSSLHPSPNRLATDFDPQPDVDMTTSDIRREAPTSKMIVSIAAHNASTQGLFLVVFSRSSGLQGNRI